MPTQLPDRMFGDSAVTAPHSWSVSLRGVHDDATLSEALVDRVYEAVKALLMDHEIEPGARIGIESTARALSVSPTPVREALAHLEADGLVTRRAQAGYRATDLLSPDEVEDLYEMRLLLEPQAARLAARRASEAALDELERLFEEMRATPMTGNDYADYSRFALLDHKFHIRLATEARRPLLVEAIERLHAHLHMFRLRSAPIAKDATVLEHERVLLAVLRRREDRAAEAMTEHLRASRARVTEQPTPAGEEIRSRVADASTD